MKLIIKRDQAAITGMLGGHKGVRFTLAYRLELTQEEMQLVERYKLHDYPVTWKTFDGHRVPADTIGGMLAGKSETLTDVTALVGNETTLKNACDGLPPLFEVARSFGGEESVEYPRA